MLYLCYIYVVLYYSLRHFKVSSTVSSTLSSTLTASSTAARCWFGSGGAQVTSVTSTSQSVAVAGCPGPAGELEKSCENRKEQRN